VLGALVNRCVPVAIIDKQLNICHCNAPLRELLRLGDAATPHKPRFVSHSCEQEFKKAIEDVTNGQIRHLPVIGLRPSSAETIWINGRLFPAKHRGHDLALGVFCATTETAADRQQREDINRHILVGELVDIVAHELNNTLASVLGFSQFLAKEDLSADAGGDLQQISDSARLCRRLVDRLLSCVKKQRPGHTRIDINDLVARQLSLLAGGLASSNIFVQLRMGSGLDAVGAEPHSLRVVIANIITNARQAMPDGGTLTIETSAAPSQREEPPDRCTSRVAEHTVDFADQFIQVRFTDIGSGVAPVALPHIFEPFFTMHGETHDGIGLSICRSIIGKIGGTIRVEHTSPRGTTIIVTLPVAKPHSIFDHINPDQHTPTEKISKKVLLVDDDISCCKVIQIALTREGHAVDITHDGEEAMARIDAQPYDIILLDVNMPRLDGRQLYEILSRKDPQQAGKMIFITGDVMDDNTQQFLRDIPNPHLMKPFDVDKMNKLVREM